MGNLLEHIDLHQMQEIAQRELIAKRAMRDQRQQVRANCDPDLDFMAFKELPKKCWMLRFCLSHLKNNSIWQRGL
jgi:hypothetical protein